MTYPSQTTIKLDCEIQRKQTEIYDMQADIRKYEKSIHDIKFKIEISSDELKELKSKHEGTESS